MVHVCPKINNFQGQKNISPLLIICFKVHNLATTKGESVRDYIQQEARNDCLERRYTVCCYTVTVTAFRVARRATIKIIEIRRV